MNARPRRQSGVTLMEVLLAVTLLSLLSAGMLTAMRVGLDALNKSNARLLDNRRVAAVERILQQQVGGFMPVVAQCVSDTPQVPAQKMPFFQGKPEAMRFVSTYSLDGAWRGLPQILELLVIPGAEGVGASPGGQRNSLYRSGRRRPALPGTDARPVAGGTVPRFRPASAGPGSFVLADKLARCRFGYLEAPPSGAPPAVPDRWRGNWVSPAWPLGVRIEMEPLDPDPARLHVVTITAPLRVRRNPEIQYGDY